MNKSVLLFLIIAAMQAHGGILYAILRGEMSRPMFFIFPIALTFAYLFWEDKK